MHLINREEFSLAPKESKLLADLVKADPKHKVMLQSLEDNIVELNRATNLFGKAQTQFMDDQMVISHLTPLRNLRQILAQIDKTFEAYRDNDIRCRKKEIEVDILKKRLVGIKEGTLVLSELEFMNSADKPIKIDDKVYAAEIVSLEIEAKLNELFSIRKSVSGAIREMANYNAQYKAIKASKGIGEFTERDVEEEEEEYHISKAFQQGLRAARAKNGVIDEGNHIYLEQLGINGGMAQAYVSEYLMKEQEMIGNKIAPSYQMYLEFITRMTTIFKGSTKVSAEYKGIEHGPTDLALLE